MATWAASGEPRLRRWRRAGGYVLAARHGLRFLVEPAGAAWRVRTPDGRFLGEYGTLDDCEARVRDVLRSKA